MRTPQSVCGRTGGRRSQPGEQGGQCERTGRLARGCLSPMLARPGAGNLASMLRGREQGRLGGTWAGHRGGYGTFGSGSAPALMDLTAPSLLGSAFIPGDPTAGTGPGRVEWGAAGASSSAPWLPASPGLAVASGFHTVSTPAMILVWATPPLCPLQVNAPPPPFLKY